MTPCVASRKPTYKACNAHAFRAEFGVCRGEAISCFEDLNLGDIYKLKQQINWMPVTATSDTETEFVLELAANLACKKLTTLAHLIFMTTTGRRADVRAALSDGHLFLICETEIQVGPEYVLIDIERRNVDFTPVIVPTPVAPMLPAVPNRADAQELRLHG